MYDCDDNVTEASPTAYANYKPIQVSRGRHGGYTLEECKHYPKEEYLVAVDALYHYFVEEEEGEAYLNEDRDLSQGEALAKLITRKYHDGVYLDNTAYQHEAPVWTKFRDSTTFISGDVIDYAVESTVKWLKFHHGEDMVILDASKYHQDTAKGATPPDFEQFMQLANNMSSVIEEGVINLYPNDTRAAMAFLKAGQYEPIENNAYGDSKWLAEGRILAHELVNIRSFQRNFNLLVITGAARYIHSDQINLNNIYRLLAKLGRTNTRVVFLG